MSSTKAEVLAAARKYPKHGAALAQAFHDLTLAQRWLDVKLVELPQSNLYVLQGRQTKDAATERIVYPMPLERPTSMDEIIGVFDQLEPTPLELTLGIAAPDSSIVYYTVKNGIVPPKETPD